MDYCNDVNDWLTVGGDLDLAWNCTGQTYEETIDELLAHGVTHVLDLRNNDFADEDKVDWVLAGLPVQNYAHAPIVDSWAHIPSDRWFASVDWFTKNFLRGRLPGHRLYVHCMMGVNRGPSVAMNALLLDDPGLDPFDAFLAVRSARPCAGLVYARAVGIRHLLGEDADIDETKRGAIERYAERVQNYWTPERTQMRRKIIWG